MKLNKTENQSAWSLDSKGFRVEGFFFNLELLNTQKLFFNTDTVFMNKSIPTTRDPAFIM